MAFAGAFSPSAPPPQLGQPGKSHGYFLRKGTGSTVPSPRTSPCMAPSSPPSLPKTAADLPDLDIGQNAVDQDVEDEATQFAPLLQLRRKQVMEATERSKVGSNTDDMVSDALDAMIVLNEASRSADALYEDLLRGSSNAEGKSSRGMESLGGSCDVAKMGFRNEQAAPTALVQHLRANVACPAPGVGATLRRIRWEAQGVPYVHVPENVELGRSTSSSAPPCSKAKDEDLAFASREGLLSIATGAFERASNATERGAQVVGSVAEAGWSVAEGFLSMATGALERTTSRTELPCVEGLLRVDATGDSCIHTSQLRETLRVVLHNLLEPLAQVRSIDLSICANDLSSSISDDPHRTPKSGWSFAYRISVVDPYDLEPLRETLFLEAESGGARRLLPLITEQLCDEGHPMPRHLKVRLEVRSGV